MNVTEQVVRVYGSASYYGPDPRTAPFEGPIVLENFPARGSRSRIWLGEPIDVIHDAEANRRALGRLLMERMFLRTYPEDPIERAEVFASYVKEHTSTVGEGLNWFVTLTVERDAIVADEHVSSEPDFWLDIASALDISKTAKAWAEPLLDLLATYIAGIIDSTVLEELVIIDHVTFLASGRPPIYWPDFKITGGRATISVGNLAIDGERLKQSFATLATLSSQQHDWLLTISHWYLRVIREDDTWKRFLWAFTAIEILTNKLWRECYDRVAENLSLRSTEDRLVSSSELPITKLLWPKDDPSRVPITAKFSFLSLALCPGSAQADTALFSTLKGSRNSLAHGDLRNEDDLPAGQCVDLLKRYLALAVTHRLGL